MIHPFAAAITAALACTASVWTTPRVQTPGADAPARIDRLIASADAAVPAGRFDEMAASAEQAVALSRSIADAARLGESLFRLGQARFYQSRPADALDAHREAVEIATRLGNAGLRARGLNGVGLALREQGEYDRAIDYMTQALAAHRASRNRVEEVRVQRNIAVLYWQLGDLRRAETTIRAASALARALGNTVFESITLQALGGILADAGRPREALAADRRALALAENLKMPALFIDLGVTMGQALTAVGERARAVEMFTTTLTESQRAGYRIGEAVAMGHLGMTALADGRADEALTWLLRARGVFATLGATTHLGNALANEFQVGRALRALGRNEEALVTLRAAMDMVDRLRAASVPTEATTASVNAARTDVFLETAGLLTDLGRHAEAFDVSERYHARAFLDVLAASRVGVRPDAASAALERTLLAKAAALQNELWQADLAADRRRTLDADLAAVDEEFERIARAGRRGTPGYAVHNPALLDAARVQRQIGADGTIVLEYMVGATRSFVWAVSRDGVAAAALPGRATLDRLADRYRRALATRVSVLTLERAVRDCERAAAALAQAVLAPIAPALPRDGRLVIVTDGALAFVPFETLRTGGAPGSLLLDRFDVSYAPSASALSAIAQARPGAPGPPRALLAVGDPASPSGRAAPLPAARIEVHALGALVPASERRLLLGAEAREDRVKAAALDEFRYLHFATHGRLDPVNPARSGLVLAPSPASGDDGVLQMREIMRLRINADMVTLSACESGLGRVVNGEGVMGLTRAFLYAGAQSVVVSLWDVNDAATADLMRRLYTALGRGQARDAALAAAKRALAHGPKRLWRHPYFWAPFVFTGAAR